MLCPFMTVGLTSNGSIESPPYKKTPLRSLGTFSFYSFFLSTASVSLSLFTFYIFESKTLFSFTTAEKALSSTLRRFTSSLSLSLPQHPNKQAKRTHSKYNTILVGGRKDKLAIENQSDSISFVKTNHNYKLVVGPMGMVPLAEKNKDDGFGPQWLKPMLKANFFIQCPYHGDSNKCECNMFCLDCMGNALCSYCLIHHRDHRIVQIRRSSYHNVIRVNEVQKYIDISAIQTYVINSAKIVFLNERPQPRPGKGVTNTCEICCRSLLDSYRFCSLGCKLGGMKRGDPELTFTLRPKMNHKSDGTGFESDDSSTLTNSRKFRKAGIFNRLIIDRLSSDHGNSSGDDGANISPTTPPIINHHQNSRRRKGIPHRAPF